MSYYITEELFMEIIKKLEQIVKSKIFVILMLLVSLVFFSNGCSNKVQGGTLELTKEKTYVKKSEQGNKVTVIEIIPYSKDKDTVPTNFTQDK